MDDLCGQSLHVLVDVVRSQPTLFRRLLMRCMVPTRSEAHVPENLGPDDLQSVETREIVQG